MLLILSMDQRCGVMSGKQKPPLFPSEFCLHSRRHRRTCSLLSSVFRDAEEHGQGHPASDSQNLNPDLSGPALLAVLLSCLCLFPMSTQEPYQTPPHGDTTRLLNYV